MQVHKIKSRVLRELGVKIEGANRSYIEARLAEVKTQHDPDARIVTIPATR